MSTQELLAHLAPEKEKIDAAMQADLAAVQSPMLAQIIEHGIFNGGKRIRPLLTVLAARICQSAAERPSKNTHENLYQLAMVFEYLHAASLLHDDVIDHADQRRGKRSANAIWGNSPVILAGDFLHTRAMELAGRHGGEKCLSIIGAATCAMVEAEFLQMQNAENHNLSEDDYFAVLQGKTAALIAAACETGGVFSGADTDHCQALRLYGNNLGLAFQIIDDLLDYLGDSSKTGKAVGNDLLEGKMTLPLIHTLAKAESADRDFLFTLLKSSKDKKAAAIAEVIDIIETYQGFSYARHRAKALMQNALEGLDIFTGNVEKKTLIGLADYVLTRNK